MKFKDLPETEKYKKLLDHINNTHPRIHDRDNGNLFELTLNRYIYRACDMRFFHRYASLL